MTATSEDQDTVQGLLVLLKEDELIDRVGRVLIDTPVRDRFLLYDLWRAMERIRREWK